MFIHGETIRYVMDNLGVAGADGFVMSGDLGRYLGPAPDGYGGIGWHLTEPANFPGKICPVNGQMIERA
jgi:hypothetical protein